MRRGTEKGCARRLRTRAKFAINRNPKSMPDEVKLKIANEMADIVTYLDLLAIQFDIDLSEAITSKFNEVSNRVKSSIFMFVNRDGEVSVYDDNRIPF